MESLRVIVLAIVVFGSLDFRNFWTNDDDDDDDAIIYQYCVYGRF